MLMVYSFADNSCDIEWIIRHSAKNGEIIVQWVCDNFNDLCELIGDEDFIQRITTICRPANRVSVLYSQNPITIMKVFTNSGALDFGDLYSGLAFYNGFRANVSKMRFDYASISDMFSKYDVVDCDKMIGLSFVIHYYSEDYPQILTTFLRVNDAIVISKTQLVFMNLEDGVDDDIEVINLIYNVYGESQFTLLHNVE